MYVVLFLMVFSVFIRRFVPAKGFLLDPKIEALTQFGASRKIELRNLSGYEVKDLVTIAEEPAVIKKPVVQQSNVSNASQSTAPVSEGIDLKDIKGRTYKEVDTDYMYGNMDSSNESLADTLRKGGL